MIQANELRIGNYLGYNGFTVLLDSLISPQPLVDLRYSDKWIVDLFDGAGSITDTIDTIKPIPLTEQWLVDFGFERGLGWDDEQYYVIRFENTEFFIYVNNDGYESDYNHNITTVHHLQNLCYFATGNELTKK